MKLVINQAALWPLVQSVAGVVERRHDKPILNNILIEANNDCLRFVSSDLDVEVIQETKHKITESGATTVPAKRFFDICRSLPADTQVEISDTAGKMLIKAGRGRFNLPTLPAEGFPIVGSIVANQRLSLAARTLEKLLQDTAFAMAYQDVRYYLNGLLLEYQQDGTLRAVATDGHRLALSECNIAAQQTNAMDAWQMIVPRKGVFEIIRILDGADETIDLIFGNSVVQLRRAGRLLTSKLVDGRYPDYDRVIPIGNDKIVIANREYLRQAFLRTVVVCNERFRGIRITVEKGVLHCYAYNSERQEAEEDLAVQYDGLPLEIGFNGVYLLDALGAIKSESVRLEFSGSGKSCLISAEGDASAKYVVMPVRL
jgi:DNA polymerase III subunit beta